MEWSRSAAARYILVRSAIGLPVHSGRSRPCVHLLAVRQHDLLHIPDRRAVFGRKHVNRHPVSGIQGPFGPQTGEIFRPEEFRRTDHPVCAK